ncbi:hypothetical protein IDJ77_21155 [Mucilaginibacter sp. ZT4R22]|uniref:Uncharacterized protein n=1 Tax=Mucilaginibacter pankratovii TaxID=2772110 RepID=A0ABR7WVL0_9SPHI|nr:hypothetical protein [Mucilaginibacter pankratovii]MBD1366335.1 hypothetical protein [Mucilaginibacter pankratovii]
MEKDLIVEKVKRFNLPIVIASDSVATIGKQSRYAGLICLPGIASSLRFLAMTRWLNCSK